MAPVQTLTDKEYDIMSNASNEVIREIGVETGCSNIQFAVDRKNGQMIVVEIVIGRKFKEGLQKAKSSLERGHLGLGSDDKETIVRPPRAWRNPEPINHPCTLRPLRNTMETGIGDRPLPGNQAM